MMVGRWWIGGWAAVSEATRRDKERESKRFVVTDEHELERVYHLRLLETLNWFIKIEILQKSETDGRDLNSGHLYVLKK